MPKIIQEREKCIGCGTCVAICSDFCTMGEDGKATLKNSKDNGNGFFEADVDDIGCNKEAVDACPVQIIKIEK